MTDPGAPRRGRHSSDDGTGAFPVTWSGGRGTGRAEGDRLSSAYRDSGRTQQPTRGPGPRWAPSGAAYGPAVGNRRVSGLLDRDLSADPDRTGPVGRHSDPPPGRGEPPRDPRGDDEVAGGVRWPADGYVPEPGRHPSAPLPPRPPGVWDRLHRAGGTGGGSAADDAAGDDAAGDDAPTEARPLPVDGPPPVPADGHGRSRNDRDPQDVVDEWPTDAHPLEWQDRTGGLDVIGDHVDDRWWNRGRRRGSAAPHHPAAHDEHADAQLAEDELTDDEHADDEHGYLAHPPRRRRRRPLAVLLVLLLLAGVVAGVVIGGKTLLGVFNPAAEDFSGPGTGSVEVRIGSGDTLSDIARTLVDAGVIASTGPFVDAAEANAAAKGIQPGVYAMREEMSGQAALDLLLEPSTRLVSQVTVPEGFTVADTLQRLADTTGIPLADFEAVAADPAALGLPDYAGGQLEGYLFPATYDFEPGTAPADMLRRMVRQFVQVSEGLQLEQRAEQIGRTPAEIVTIASMIESETRLDEERPDVAQVVYNRLEQGIPLGIDATLAYGLDKNGNDLTRDDLTTDSPFNTRTRQGLPPTPISAPGEASLEAALTPSTGGLLYYVLESADGAHFFTDSYAEFEAAVQRCAQAGLGCGG